MTFIIVWILCIVLTFVVAKKNGRDTNMAILLGLVFGFVALLGYLIAGESFEHKLEMMKASKKKAK